MRAKETKKDVAELDDLLKIQRATGDIVKHITDFAVDAVDKGPIHDMRSQYMPKILIESAHMKTENKLRKVDQDLKFVSDVCKKLDHRIDGLKEIYCKRSDFDKELGQMAAQKDFADMKNKMQHFAKETDVMKIVGELKAKVDANR